MKILIAYYSRSGGTEKVAEALRKELWARGHFVDIEKIKPVKEHSFFAWWHIRLVKSECKVQPPAIKDVSKYDAICIGSPNWTRLSLPVARYLNEITGLKYKKIGFFATTFLPPALEWYLFSAYLLDFTFSRIISKKGARLVDSVLFSSVFKWWGVNSSYGQKILKNFCHRIETPIISFKDYVLGQREVEGNRLIVVALLIFNLYLLTFQIVVSFFWKEIFSWDEISTFFILGLFVYFSILTLTERRRNVFLGKYIAGGSLTTAWTLCVFFLEPILGRIIILGYIFCIMLISFFRDLKTVLITGLVTILSYIYLFFYYPFKESFYAVSDLILLLLGIGVTYFITQNMQRHYINLLEIQDEIEVERSALDVKVRARTNELEELAQSLEGKVKERTKELQEKIQELERINKLSVGRELKMIEFKKEIEELKKDLEKYKPDA